MKGVDCSRPTETNNDGFIQRWNRTKQTEYRNVQAHSFRYLQRSTLSPKWRQDEIKLTKAKQAFFLLTNKADSKVTFQFKEARLYVKRIRTNPTILASHNEPLLKGYPARYNFTRVELKTITFSRDLCL